MPWYLFVPRVSQSSNNMTQLVRLFKLAKMVKMVRLFRLMRIVNRLSYALLVRTAVNSVLRFFGTVVLSAHWSSCMFYGIAANEMQNSEGNWISNQQLERKPVLDKYIASLYWVIMTMTTVGYGDVHPVSTAGRGFTITLMMFGAAIFAYGITNIVSLVSGMNQSEWEFRKKMDQVNEYM